MMNFMKFFTMKKVFLILGLACTIGMTSCGDDDKEPGNVPLTDIRIDRESIKENVRTGAVKVTLKVYPIPANATDVDFKWESKDANVATAGPGVNLGEGEVTILSSGSTVVTVRSGQVSKDLPVEGFIDVTSLTGLRLTMIGTDATGAPATVTLANSDTTAVPRNTVEWTVGDVVKVNSVPDPINANTATYDSVNFTWASSANNVATVDKTGKITVVGEGYATITVKCVEYDKIEAVFTIKGVKPDDDEE
jgi:uncharacterized protein YjdB